MFNSCNIYNILTKLKTDKSMVKCNPQCIQNRQTFQKTCSHPPQGEHESLNAAEELTWMLTLFGHRHFSDSNEMEQTKKSKLKQSLHIQGQEAIM
jgi:hypothetical protein